MKTLTLLTTVLVLCVTAAQAQTRLENEFLQLEQTALSVDKQKAEAEKARAAAEANRARLEARENMKKAMKERLGQVTKLVEARFKVKTTQSIQTPMRELIMPGGMVPTNYILMMNKFDNGAICQLAIVNHDRDARYSYPNFNVSAFCASSTDGTSSLVVAGKSGELTELSSSYDTKREAAWNIFSDLRKMDIAQDQAKAAVYTPKAISDCLKQQYASRASIAESIYEAADNEYTYSYSSMSSAKRIAHAEAVGLEIAIQQQKSLAEFTKVFPACAESQASR